MIRNPSENHYCSIKVLKTSYLIQNSNFRNFLPQICYTYSTARAYHFLQRVVHLKIKPGLSLRMRPRIAPRVNQILMILPSLNLIKFPYNKTQKN